MSNRPKPPLSQPPTAHELCEMLGWLDEAISRETKTLNGWKDERDVYAAKLADLTGQRTAGQQMGINPSRIPQMRAAVTAREDKALHLVTAEGMTDREAADAMGYSQRRLRQMREAAAARLAGTDTP